jgi:hypothetical protein
MVSIMLEWALLGFLLSTGKFAVTHGAVEGSSAFLPPVLDDLPDPQRVLAEQEQFKADFAAFLEGI